MRTHLLAALFTAATLASSGPAGAQILAEGQISLAGWRSGEAATGVELVMSFDDNQGWTDDPALFDQVIWTPEDVGRIVGIGSWLDDPGFPDAQAALTNGLDGLIHAQAWIQPGGGGPGVGRYESRFFSHVIREGPDLGGMLVDGIALRLDALTLNVPDTGWVDATFTLLVIGRPDGISVTPELAQCTEDLEQARISEAACIDAYWQVANDLGLARDELDGCQSDLADAAEGLANLGAELSSARAELASAEAELGATRTSLAAAESELAAALADADADGVRDPGDACLGTEPGAATDGLGCSLFQFCTAIDATTGSGRSTCNRSDWRNDEPLADSPNDCKATAGRCEPR